jgi:hypothetical protein
MHNTTQYVLDTSMRKQTQITSVRYKLFTRFDFFLNYETIILKFVMPYIAFARPVAILSVVKKITRENSK